MNVCILQILYFDRIDVFEETDVNKTSKSKELSLLVFFKLILREKCPNTEFFWSVFSFIQSEYTVDLLF